ncbi:radical SAM/SPASM domain-containing protein [Planomonospora venezuelensis]|uniref:MoaA/NifB/PqqE/SkfB family radical SAM enzyme n=1 Tax=Planomonospora venezuelensis TaxID=1999 RepID=A0A841DC79_PLAVE|nr:radical SAM/SPASM domain-containing protein [Planomonospora venezuelensis]MBB5965898.1 MoaA/NifB/PqqE/SkfB family radical SAM enzyme [Planomonospora venezuelensis]GIN04091.1 hypothetical protein Pve01_57490 [Planomonospora venezuelensis]
MMTLEQTAAARSLSGWHLEFELTGKCQLTCVQCYASSGPGGGHGTMTAADWRRLITEAKTLGVSHVQFIGGEPTLYPDFATLLGDAIDAGMGVEVYSNLVTVRTGWWELFSHPNVRLATSYYSDRVTEHGAVTGRRGAYGRTKANIAEAVKRGIPLRVGIIDVLAGQRVEQARAELAAMGVTAIGTDRVRGVGRAAATVPDVSQLCGQCGDGKAAISPDGDVWPCVLSRWMVAGNVRRTPLAEIVKGVTWSELVSAIPTAGKPCNPQQPSCRPTERDGNDCAPSESPACNPRFCAPDTKSKPPKK